MAWAAWLSFILPINALWQIFIGISCFAAGNKLLSVIYIVDAIYLILTTVLMKKETKVGYYLIISVYYVNFILDVLLLNYSSMVISLVFAILNNVYFYKRRDYFDKQITNVISINTCNLCDSSLSGDDIYICTGCKKKYHKTCIDNLDSKICECGSKNFRMKN